MKDIKRETEIKCSMGTWETGGKRGRRTWEREERHGMGRREGCWDGRKEGGEEGWEEGGRGREIEEGGQVGG